MEYRLTQALTGGGKRNLPDVGFTVIHTGDAPWVHLLVNLEIYADRKIVRPKAFDPIYGGKVQWNLNPKTGLCAATLRIVQREPPRGVFV